MKYPCKDCEDRVVGCHSLCATYKEARARYKEYDEQRRAEQRIETELAYMNAASRRRNRILRSDPKWNR